KSWVYTKTTDYKPGGVLSLGQILSDPTNPASVLQPLGPLPLPAELKPEHRRQDGVNMDTASEMGAMFGVWAKVTSLPIGVETEMEKDASSELIWRFESLDSNIMSPPIEYTRNAMNHGDVQEALKKWGFKKRVYMITGVRTAHGARMEKTESHSSSVQAQLAADGSPHGVPVGGGVRGGHSSSATNKVTFEKTTDFVWAYRLNEVNYRGKITQKSYTKGETSAAGDLSTPEAVQKLDDFDVI
ncbi:hypothetical protein K469DRAFT_531594, partial [Zopfia rhizophila CBS 207.26]